MSISEAKIEAVRRAKLQALADAFGTRIAQTSNTHISNVGEKSDVSFFTSGTNEVMGEWIETIGTPTVKIEYCDNLLVVDVFIKGKGRRITRQQISLVVKSLRNTTDDASESDVFYHGDKLYLSFKSPVNGCILVYLIDYASEQVFCLLPYSSSDKSSFTVRQDLRYVFFSEKDAQDCMRGSIDEYTLTCSGSEIEHNELVVLFSTDNLFKENTVRLSDSLPRQLPLSDFNKWLIKQKISTPNLQTINKPLTINPKRL